MGLVTTWNVCLTNIVCEDMIDNMTNTVKYLTYATGNDPLIRRAFAAYYRSGHSDGLTDTEITIPSNSSYLCEFDGKQYVVLNNINGVLAVYRVRNNGVLKGLRRWPAEIEVKP